MKRERQWGWGGVKRERQWGGEVCEEGGREIDMHVLYIDGC